jgi:hypothetical protein
MATTTSNRYARTAALRKWIDFYNYRLQDGREPTVVNLYAITLRYGGPEEGGWYFECGEPIRGVCVFSKKQAIRAALELDEWALQEFEEEYDRYGYATYRVCFEDKYGDYYPKERPHYE